MKHEIHLSCLLSLNPLTLPTRSGAVASTPKLVYHEADLLDFNATLFKLKVALLHRYFSCWTLHGETLKLPLLVLGAALQLYPYYCS
jgi:hypothetical protein